MVVAWIHLLPRPLAVDHHTICSLIGSVKLLLDGLLFGFEGLPPELFGFGPLLPFPELDWKSGLALGG